MRHAKTVDLEVYSTWSLESAKTRILYFVSDWWGGCGLEIACSRLVREGLRYRYVDSTDCAQDAVSRL